jgi:hypothetical protein
MDALTIREQGIDLSLFVVPFLGQRFDKQMPMHGSPFLFRIVLDTVVANCFSRFS